MKITTFNEDLLNLQPLATRLEKFISVEHQFVEGSLVIALGSKFGSGKTTFLDMWKADLDRRKEDDNTPLVVSLNAWESDYYGDPLFAIISGLIDCLNQNGQSAKSISDAAKDIGWFATAIGGQIVQKFTGIDPVAAGELAEKKKSHGDGAALVPKDTFSAFQGRKAAMKNLKAAIKKFVASSKPSVLFLVDELDRCRPDYAISYLETIKHIFDVQGVVFILAADRRHLENSAKTAFGRDLDFEEYYRKFVHREVSLPPISDSDYMKLATKYVNYYLQRDGLRNCCMNLETHRVKNISELVGALRMTPRQIQEVFRILGHISETSEKNKGCLGWCLTVGLIAMAAFKTGYPKIYHQLGCQTLEPNDALHLLTDLLGDRNTHIGWWFTIFLTGGGLKMVEGKSLNEVMVDVGITKEGEESRFDNNYYQWEEGWGYITGCHFEDIYKKIEHIIQWA